MKQSKHQKVKHHLCALCAFAVLQCTLLLSSVQAQGAYMGGTAGAYTSAKAQVLIGDAIIPDTIQVFPNPIVRGEILHIEALDLHNKLDIVVRDIYGHLLMRRSFWDVQGKYAVALETDVFAAGIYSVEVRRDGKVTIQKIIVLGK
jgi:hypothetical protein